MTILHHFVIDVLYNTLFRTDCWYLVLIIQYWCGIKVKHLYILKNWLLIVKYFIEKKYIWLVFTHPHICHRKLKTVLIIAYETLVKQKNIKVIAVERDLSNTSLPTVSIKLISCLNSFLVICMYYTGLLKTVLRTSVF